MMKVAIIEDEALAVERLERMLTELVPDIVIAAKLPSIESSVVWLRENSADLIFLDIQLTDGMSFSIFDRIEVRTPIIFTTAYDKYVLRAFDLNTVSYLLKPIKKDELLASIEKFNSLRSAFSIDFERLIAQIKGEPTTYRRRFLIQVADKLKKVGIEEVAYFFALDKCVFLRTFSGQTYPVDMTLEQIETELNPADYFRINRKYIVGMNAITNMVAWSKRRIKVGLTPPADIPEDAIVSMERYADFKRWLDK